MARWLWVFRLPINASSLTPDIGGRGPYGCEVNTVDTQWMRHLKKLAHRATAHSQARLALALAVFNLLAGSMVKSLCQCRGLRAAFHREFSL